MSGIFSKPKPPPALPPVPQAPTTNNAQAQEEINNETRRRLAALNQSSGRASTILTSGRGVSGAAPVTRASLLGGN